MQPATSVGVHGFCFSKFIATFVDIKQAHTEYSMKKVTILSLIVMLLAALPMANAKKMEKSSKNPFLEPYTTKYEIPPFDKITYDDYLPAIEAAIEEQRQEINAIVRNRAVPDFDNTILALDNSGQTLNRVCYVLFALTESDNTPEFEEIAAKAMPMISAASDEISMNEALFQRVKQVYDRRADFNLNVAQTRLLEHYYKDFVRGGALLSAADKDSLKRINQEISNLFLDFSSNVLKETNSIEIVIDNEADLAGLPANTIAQAAEEAANRGKAGKWVFTVQGSTRLPVLTYADNRDLRRRMYEAYTHLSMNDNEYNNFAIINRIIKLRTQKANLLGFDTFADYQIDNVMAKTPENAERLLYQIWEPAVAKAKEEIADMQAYANAHGDNITIEPWDYYYYAEEVKKEKFNFSEDEVRPYFSLDNVVKGVFLMANKLYGITFTEIKNAPKYNPGVTVYDVKDADGKHLAVFMSDYMPRASKRQGAWMSEFKGEYNYEGVSERPIIFNVASLTAPTKDTPSLLTIDEVKTVFHEFGHALQGMLTTASFRGQAGTNVDRDFVELASQIDEHWAVAPEFLKEYAFHYKTGEPIPDNLIAKIEETGKFNQGFMTVELVGAALLDLEWHKVNYCLGDIDVVKFEQSVARRIGLPREIQFRYRSTYFNHIFGSDGYAAGYYTYLWAEVLEADAFEMFRQHGIFDPATAKSYRENILEPGGSEDPMILFERFRGQAPTVDALLENRGLK